MKALCCESGCCRVLEGVEVGSGTWSSRFHFSLNLFRSSVSVSGILCCFPCCLSSLSSPPAPGGGRGGGAEAMVVDVDDDYPAQGTQDIINNININKVSLLLFYLFLLSSLLLAIISFSFIYCSKLPYLLHSPHLTHDPVKWST